MKAVELAPTKDSMGKQMAVLKAAQKVEKLVV